MKKEMTKYDVMKKELKSIGMAFVKGYAKKIKSKIINGEEKQSLVNVQVANEIMKTLDTTANICYEVYMDITTLSEEELAEVGFTFGDLFQIERVNQYAKILLVNAVFKKEGISFYDQVFEQAKKTKSKTNAAVEIIASLSPESQQYIAMTQRDDFSIKQIDEEGLKMINEYHESFMQQKIFPQVTANESAKTESQNAIQLLRKIPDRKINMEIH